eukprot:gene261-270_t
MSTGMDTVLRQVDLELAKTPGPYFLGDDISLVDIMYTPFLERMAASLPYFKGFVVRGDAYPHLKRWYEAMDTRETYQGIKSDYVAAEYAKEIDGGAWQVEAEAEQCFEPMIPLDAATARRDASRNLINNHAAVVRFSLRGVSAAGSPRVSAPLADPNARPKETYSALIDIALRHVTSAMITGVRNPEVGRQMLVSQTDRETNAEVLRRSLSYLRDRVGVPRDMSVHGARQFRAHLNWMMSTVGS